MSEDLRSAGTLLHSWQRLLAPVSGLELPTALLLIEIALDTVEASKESFGRLPERTGLSDRNIRRLILHLSELGWIESTSNSTGMVSVKLTGLGLETVAKLGRTASSSER